MADNGVSMSPSALRDYEPRVHEYTRQLLDRLAESCGQPIDMATWFNFYSFDVMGDLAFGKRLNMLRDGVVHYYMEAVHGSQVFIAAYSHLIWLTPLLKAIPILNREYTQFQNWLEEQVQLRRKVWHPSSSSRPHPLSLTSASV